MPNFGDTLASELANDLDNRIDMVLAWAKRPLLSV